MFEQTEGSAMVKHFIIAYDSANDLIHVVHRGSWKSVIPPKKLQDAFIKVKYKWSVVVLVTARDSEGKLQVVSRQIRLPRKVRKAQLAPFLTKIHSDTCYDVRYNHPAWVIEDATWLADPLGQDWSEEDIQKAMR